jgi:hypothetical protein
MTQLPPAADRAFDDYVKNTETRLDGRPHVAVDKPGVSIVPGGPQATVDLKGAILHDWAGAVLVPGGTLKRALAVLESYDDYKQVYAPDVTASKALGHEGNRWRISLDLYKFMVFSATYSTEYEVEFRPLGPDRWAVLSHSTKVAERYGGKELAVGTGHGYLWRLNAYWLLEQRPQGLYMECRSISLSRDIPVGLGWAVRPMVTTLPRQSLQSTLEATVRAVAP